MLGRPATNKYKLNRIFWKKLNEPARRVFNRLYYQLRSQNQSTLTHPEAPPMTKEQWATLQHNVSLLAAWAADEVVKEN